MRPVFSAARSEVMEQFLTETRLNMNQYKGVVEIEILGEKRGFKFGTASYLQLCEILGCGLAEAIKRLDDLTDLKCQLNFYYTGACQYIRLVKKGEQEPTFEEVANWVDSLLPEQKEQIGETAFKHYEDPNKEAPQQTGQS